jgi:hypothetical protein
LKGGASCVEEKKNEKCEKFEACVSVGKKGKVWNYPFGNVTCKLDFLFHANLDIFFLEHHSQTSLLTEFSVEQKAQK